MRVLFMDDDENRHRTFDRLFGQRSDMTIMHVRSSKEAMWALQVGEPFDLLCLDHDLGNNVNCEVDEDTGHEVALFVRDHLDDTRFPKSVIVHSWNPDGAERMRLAIEQAGIHVVKKPFCV